MDNLFKKHPIPYETITIAKPFLLVSPDPSKYLLFASRGSIRRVSLDTDDKTDVTLNIGRLENVVALDFDYKDEKIYFTDVSVDVIK